MKIRMDPGSKRSDRDSYSSKEKYLQVLSQAVKHVGLKRHFTWLTPIGQKEPHGSSISAIEMERQEYLQNSSSHADINKSLCLIFFFFLG